ncbi:MAG: S9 family peptidase [Gemmatimonadales bacterium]
MAQPGSPPPKAPQRPQSMTVHGETRVDEYGWLKDRSDPAVLQYLEAENEYAKQALAPLGALEGTLYQEMLGRIRQTDLTVPYRDGDYWYYQRTEEGKQYPIHCRKRGSLAGPEEVLVDLNEEAVGHPYCSLGTLMVSPDARSLAYSLDLTGFREYTLRVIDLATRSERTAPISKSGSVAWAADSATIFFTTENEAKRDDRLFRLRLDGTAVQVFEEPDERFRVWVTRTRSRRHLLLYCASHLTSDARVLPADRPDDEWRVVIPRVHDREYDLDDDGGAFLVRTNDRGRNFRVVRIPYDGTDPGVEVVAHSDDRIIEGVDCFERFWVLWERVRGLPRILVVDRASGASREVEFPETAYDARPGTNAEWTAGAYRYQYESFVTPTSVYDYDVASATSRLLKRREVLGGYDPARYRTERLEARAADGTMIPISLIRRADGEPGRTPLFLSGYGAYGIPYPVNFNSNRLSLVDRGVAVAVAHVRGGGELGRAWHDGGRMGAKQNSFTDFIAVADFLTSSGRTAPDRLVIEGGSAGGLLMGAVLNLRPDLATAALLQVPFVDVLNTMADPSLPLTVGEYEEWGNPAVEEQYRWMRGYCPYTNLAPRPFPALLVRGSLNDSQVMFWEPAKYVARLRTLWRSERPLLLLTNLGAGHSGASGRYDRLREIAADYAFVLWRLGLVPEAPS